jgi:SM-20-related protein
VISRESIVFEQIVDDLAEKGFSVTDSFLDDREIEAILSVDEFKNKMLHFKKAGIGNSASLKINENVRGDHISWVDTRKAHISISVYVSRLKALQLYLNKTLFLSLKDIELHLTSYPVGSYYRRHVDQFKQQDHRKISVILYLNRGWRSEQGGQLRVYSQSNEIDIFPVAGRLVCMRSDLIEHEVLPASRERLSVTGWMLDQLIDIK